MTPTFRAMINIAKTLAYSLAMLIAILMTSPILLLLVIIALTIYAICIEQLNKVESNQQK